MKHLLALLGILMLVGTTQAQYGDNQQHNDLTDTFQSITTTGMYIDAEAARSFYTGASEGEILRVGFGYADDWTPLTDVRLVAVDGVLVCYSDAESGCNGYGLVTTTNSLSLFYRPNE